jgi:putative ABC transport system permease protein
LDTDANPDRRVKYASLVWAALWRRPTDFLLTLLAVTAAFTLFALMIGSKDTYQRIIANARLDRLTVTSRFFNPHNGLPLALRDRLARIAGVSAVGAFKGLDGYYGDIHNIVWVYGVDEQMRQAWPEAQLSAAQWDRLLSTPAGVFITRQAAQRWHLKEGDALPVTTPPGTRADGAKSWPFVVVGVMRDDPSWVDFMIFANYRYIDGALPPDEQGYVWGYRVAIRDGTRANELSQAIDRSFANSGTPTLTIPAKSSAQATADPDGSLTTRTWMVAGAGLFMILLLTANAIAQSVRERIPEFAVLKSFGFRHETLMGLVFVEAAIPCLLGAVLGTALAAALIRWPTSFMPPGLAHIPTPTVTLYALALAVGCAALLAFVGAVGPILRLRRMSVSDALAGR